MENKFIKTKQNRTKKIYYKKRLLGKKGPQLKVYKWVRTSNYHSFNNDVAHSNECLKMFRNRCQWHKKSKSQQDYSCVIWSKYI